MSTREILIENYEDALFALMMDELACSEGSRLLQENEALRQDERAAVPPQTRKHCLQAIRSGFLRKHSAGSLRFAGRLLGRLAAAVFITAALFSAAFAASPGFRAGTLNLLMSMDEELVQWSFKDSAASVSEAMSIEAAWLPEGYALTEETLDPHYSTLTYQNTLGQSFRISLLKGSLTTIVNADVEDADYWEELSVQGFSAVIIQKADTTSISWFDTNASVFIDIYSADLSSGQLRKIAEALTVIT